MKLQFVPEENPDIDTLIKRADTPETNLQRLNVSQEWIHVSALFAEKVQ